MKDLVLNLKGEYFDQIKAGSKEFEYRLQSEFWKKRLYEPYPKSSFQKMFGRIVIRKGYPKAGDSEREIIRPYRGFITDKITHPHFGPDPVWVYAIRVNDPVSV